MPKRIQRRRTRGWRMPPGAIYVGRPGQWGNPFVVGRVTPSNWTAYGSIEVLDRAHAVQLYRELMAVSPTRCAEARAELAGHDLACWCPLDQPCHADELLAIANGGTT